MNQLTASVMFSFMYRFVFIGLFILYPCMLTIQAREYTEAEVMSTVFDKKQLAMWWRWRTMQTTREDKQTALKLLREKKYIIGSYPVEADWYYLQNVLIPREKNYDKLAEAGLLFRVLGIELNRTVGPKKSLSESRKVKELIDTYVWEGADSHDFSKTSFIQSSLSTASESTLMRYAVRFIETGQRGFKIKNVELDEEELNAIVNSARGPESMYLLLSPSSFGKHKLPIDWRQRARKLISKGVPVHVGTNLRDIVRDSNGGYFYIGYIPQIDKRFTLLNALFRNSCGAVYGDYYAFSNINDYRDLQSKPYKMNPIFLPEGKCVIETPLLEAVAKDAELDVVTKIGVMEFLLQHGTPPYLGAQVFENGLSALKVGGEKALQSANVLIPELLLHYGGFMEYSVHRKISKLSNEQKDVEFLTKLILLQKGEDREYSMKLLLLMLQHPHFNAESNLAPLVVSTNLPDTDALRFMKEYCRLFGGKQSHEILKRALNSAKKRNVPQLVQFLEKAIH